NPVRFCTLHFFWSEAHSPRKGIYRGAGKKDDQLRQYHLADVGRLCLSAPLPKAEGGADSTHAAFYYADNALWFTFFSDTAEKHEFFPQQRDGRTKTDGAFRYLSVNGKRVFTYTLGHHRSLQQCSPYRADYALGHGPNLPAYRVPGH